jgi:hypothetical protein
MSQPASSGRCLDTRAQSGGGGGSEARGMPVAGVLIGRFDFAF